MNLADDGLLRSAAAAIWSSDDAAVTWAVAMDRMAWCRAAVKDSSAAVTTAPFVRRKARAAAWSLVSAASAGALVSWVEVSQA